MKQTSIQKRLLLMSWAFLFLVGCVNETPFEEQLMLERTPVIEKSIPDKISVFGGTQLTLDGDLFDRSATVLFGDVPAKEVQWLSSTSLRVVSPSIAGRIGPIPIKVVNVIEGTEYAARRDDLLVATSPPLQFSAADVMSAHAPIEMQPIQLGKGKKGLVLFSSDDMRLHLISTNEATKKISDTPISVDLTGNKFGSLLVADVNADGLEDILVAAFEWKMFVFLNDGKGGFEDPKEYAIPVSGIKLWAAGKFDGDEKTDVLFSFGSQVCVLLNQGDQGWKFSRATAAGDGIQQAVFADVNQDGYMDVLLSRSGELLAMEGTRTAMLQIPYSIVTGMRLDRFTLVGKQGDTAVSLFMAGFHLSALENQWIMGSFQNGKWQLDKSIPLKDQVIAMDVEDINGDGVKDVVLAYYQEGMQILEADAEGTFIQGMLMEKGKLFQSVQTMDIDGDQKVDLVFIEKINSGAGTQLTVMANHS